MEVKQRAFIFFIIGVITFTGESAAIIIIIIIFLVYQYNTVAV